MQSKKSKLRFIVSLLLSLIVLQCEAQVSVHVNTGVAQNKAVIGFGANYDWEKYNLTLNGGFPPTQDVDKYQFINLTVGRKITINNFTLTPKAGWGILWYSREVSKGTVAIYSHQERVHVGSLTFAAEGTWDLDYGVHAGFSIINMRDYILPSVIVKIKIW